LRQLVGAQIKENEQADSDPFYARIGTHRTCKCGAVYDRSEHIAEAREISSFEFAVCGETIENWNSAWFLDIDSLPVQLGMPND
jgi:hypothetical protein